MNTFKRIMAIALVFVFTLSFTACGKDKENTALTTKKKRTNTTTTTSSDIDIWAYLNGEGADEDLENFDEEVGTTGSVSSIRGNYTYEDVGVSFGGSDVFSPATTSKSGYPTFHWNPVSGAVKYNIYRATTKNGTYSYIDSTTATSYTDKTAISGKQYYYQVKAVKKVPTKTTTKSNTTTKKTTTATTKPTTTRNTANVPASAPTNYKTKSSIVSFYNTAANRVKTNASSVTRTLRKVEYIEDENNSSTVKTLLILGGVSEGSNNTPHTSSTPETIKAEFPVEGQDFSSTLDSSMVYAASCEYSNGYYTVKIVLKNDPTKTTDYSGTCINVLNASQYTSAAKSETRGCQILAKIYYDGSLDYLAQYAPTWVYADYQSNDIVVNGQQALAITEIWTVAY